eukprot:312845-Chlamydomonas_euryale.AAC.2
MGGVWASVWIWHVRRWQLPPLPGTAGGGGKAGVSPYFVQMRHNCAACRARDCHAAACTLEE